MENMILDKIDLTKSISNKEYKDEYDESDA